MRFDEPHGVTKLHLRGTQALQIMTMAFPKLRITFAVANVLQL